MKASGRETEGLPVFIATIVCFVCFVVSTQRFHKSDTARVVLCCRSDRAAGEIALGGLEKEDKELHQLDFTVFSKVATLLPNS